MKRLLAFAATITLAASALSGCSTESTEPSEHEKAVQQYKSALQAWNDALEDTQEDYEYCMENERNCLAAVTDGWRNLDAGGYGAGTLREEYRKRLEETRALSLCPKGDGNEIEIPLSDKDLDEKGGLSVEHIQSAAECVKSATVDLYGYGDGKSEYDDWAKQTIEDISEEIKRKAEWCTNHKSDWTEKDEKECNVAGGFDENKTYTLDEIIDMYNNSNPNYGKTIGR